MNKKVLVSVHRIREAAQANLPVVYVDGSYLYRKQQRVGSVSDCTTLPMPPLTGWESVNAANASEMSTNIPRVTQG